MRPAPNFERPAANFESVYAARTEPRRPGDGAAACIVRCAYDPSLDGTGGDTVVDHIRLFPIRDDVQWTYRVHELILPALNRAKVPVRWADLTVRHTGYVDKALRAQKLDRDRRILERELEDRPNDPFVLFNLGAIAIERRAWPQTLDFLNRSLAALAAERSGLAEARRLWEDVLAECPGYREALAKLESAQFATSVRPRSRNEGRAVREQWPKTTSVFHFSKPGKSRSRYPPINWGSV